MSASLSGKDTLLNLDIPALAEFFLALPALVFSVAAHEYAHAAAASRQGDQTARASGRLTWNPLSHIDPWMTLLLPALLWFGSAGRFTFGGAKPVPVNPRNYRDPVKGDLIVSSAGVATNFVLSAVFAILFAVVGIIGQLVPGLAPALGLVQRMAVWGIWLNLILGVFNLLPIPPLDGSHIFAHLLPTPLAGPYRKFARYGFMPLLLVLIFFPVVINTLLLPAIWGFRMLIGLVAPSFGLGSGWDIFA